ncbi:MAG: fructosamine kinase family protein [Rhodospirillales bacterium]|nr:fructosamine kinase family protein [Rhodospirillales bacterium]
MSALADRIEKITGSLVQRVEPLAGGSVGEVYRVHLADGRTVVAKTGGPASGLAVEGYMLRRLAELSELPVPVVLHADDVLLLMDYIPAGGRLDDGAQAHAAELLAALHTIRGDAFGFERDTRIGGLAQPNPPTERWLDFFRDQRLLHMGREALRAKRLPANLMDRIETLAGRLERWIEEPAHPALLHGDLWGGNILAQHGRVVGVIDPAIYYGAPEIELAFGTLFGTFGPPFFARYGQLQPLRPGFHEERRELYNLYPLLVHVRLFGGSYVAAVERTLSRYGC